MRELISHVFWIGNARDVRNLRGVLDAGIDAIIDLAMEEAPAVFPRDIVYCRFPLIDGSGNSRAVIRAAVDTTIRFVEGKVPTLVACSGGMSRSPAIAALVLAAVDHISPESASLKRVAAAGPHDVSPTLWAEIQAAMT